MSLISWIKFTVAAVMLKEIMLRNLNSHIIIKKLKTQMWVLTS